MASLQKQYVYKVSRNGVLLGVLQNVTSPFNYSHNINSAGTSMDVSVGLSANRSSESVDTLATESGDDIVTESSDIIALERQPDLVGNSNSQSLIRSYNDVEVYEFSPNNANGKIVFKGFISKWKANYGGSDIVNFTVVSYGTELSNYLILGATTLDASQASQNATQIIQGPGDKSSSYTKVAQTWTVGVSASPLVAILLKLANSGSAQTVTLKVYSSRSSAEAGGTPLATSALSIPNCSATDYTFTLSSSLIQTAGNVYFFTVEAADSTSAVLVYFQTSDAYATGNMYIDIYGGAGPDPGYSGVLSGGATCDLYFKTYYSAGATSSPYSSTDPATILESIIDSYVSRGGSINYGAGTVDFPGTSVSYTFKVNTILEGIQKCLDLAPYDWYFYVDPATNILYFKETGTTADHRMILGRHIKELNVEATVEQLKNVVYFSGGDTGGGVNLFTSQTDTASLAANKVGMERLSDNRVTLTATATTIMTGFLRENSSEAYNTTIEVLETTYDITLFRIGQIVAFAGFGNFVDQLLLQIVGITRYADSIILKLGVLPPRATATIESVIQDVTDLQTIANPTTPS